MFGYIRPLECELKVREQAEYRAHYCGVCKAIGRRYGIGERLTLSYDCAFLAVFLAALNGGASYARGNCGPRCYRGRRLIANPSAALDYAADVNVLLACHKAADDADDEKRVVSAAAKLALLRACRKAARLRPALEADVRKAVANLQSCERARVPSLDEPSGASGELLSAIVRHAPNLPQKERAAAEWMAFNLGKWVYLLDAWDDREKDGKSGAYNPFLLSGKDAAGAEFLLNVTRIEAEKAYDLVAFATPSGLLDNIMRLGLAAAQRRIFEKTPKCAANAAPVGRADEQDRPAGQPDEEQTQEGEDR